MDLYYWTERFRMSQSIKIRYDWHLQSWDVDSGESLENIEIESIEIQIILERFRSLYMISSYSTEETIFYVTDNKDEADRLFKETLAYLLYEYGPNYYDTKSFDYGAEVREAEKILMKYGFLSDMKKAFQLLEELSGKASWEQIDDLAKVRFPHYNIEFIHCILRALEVKGYVKVSWKENLVSIVKKLNF